MDGQNNQYGQNNQFEQNNQYGQYNQNYQYNNDNMNGYGNWQAPKTKKDGMGFGIASLVLGIISLLMFCTCINCITAILAIIFGIIQLVQYKEKGLAIGGIITAGISILLFTMMCIFFSIGLTTEGYSNLYDYYNSYYDEDYYDEDYYDDYYYDDYYDDYFDEDGENEFLSGSCIYL